MMDGKGGQIYIVTDSSDKDPVNPTPGRSASLSSKVIRLGSCPADMFIHLQEELLVTIDGRTTNG